jgi:hypothetical protein
MTTRIRFGGSCAVPRVRLSLPARLATVAALALGAAACASDDASERSAAPAPVAQVDQLSVRASYEPGTVSPFVQGELDHDGGGLSLTAGGKTVELTDFVIDPGASVLT